MITYTKDKITLGTRLGLGGYDLGPVTFSLTYTADVPLEVDQEEYLYYISFHDLSCENCPEPVEQFIKFFFEEERQVFISSVLDELEADENFPSFLDEFVL